MTQAAGRIKQANADVMEYWSDGVLAGTQHSMIPSLQYSPCPATCQSDCFHINTCSTCIRAASALEPDPSSQPLILFTRGGSYREIGISQTE